MNKAKRPSSAKNSSILSHNHPVRYEKQNNNMSNIKSWADASSDEESDDERIAPPPSNLPGSTSYTNLNNDDDDYDDHEEEEAIQMEKDYSFIFENPPPYTAYIGNLSYDMKKSHEFGAEVEKLLDERGCVADTDKGGEFWYMDLSW
jgi:hypothetical protein